jgi:large subunit ribosomal protein L5
MLASKISLPLHGWYKNVAEKDLIAKLGCLNIHQVPCFNKITLNIEMNKHSSDIKSVIACLFMLESISSQKAVYRKPVSYRKTSSCFVTLRGDKMWDFLSILSQVVLPRMSQNTITKGAQSEVDSLHVTRLKDPRGNLTLFIKDPLIFPQFEAVGQLEGIEDYLPRHFSMSVSFTTTARNKNEKKLLLESLQIPVHCVR